MATATIEDALTAFAELQKEVKNSSPDPEKMEKLNLLVDEWEDIKQKHVADIKRQEQKQESDSKRIEELELELVHSAKKELVKNYRETEEYKSLQHYAKHGMAATSIEQKEALRTDSNEASGFLTSSELDSRLLHNIVELSNVRPEATVKTITKKELKVIVESTIPEAQYEGELEEAKKGTPVYKEETLLPFRLALQIPVSMDSLINSEFPLESEILSVFARSAARAEGRGFVVGNGFKRPGGFIVHEDVVANTIASINSGVILFDDLITMTGALKEGYNPKFYFNRRTLANLRLQKDGVGGPLWLPGMTDANPNQIIGHNYVILNDMPDIASNAVPIAFADLKEGYKIVDRTGTIMIRDEVTDALKALVKFTMMRWNTGKVVLPEAIQTLTVTA